MRWKPGSLLLVLLVAVLLVAVAACDDDSDGILVLEDANPAFNGTFGGNVTITRNGTDVIDTVAVTLQVGSPLTGTFLFGLGGFGIISGEAIGDTATFVGTIEGPCPGTWDGTMVISVNGDSVEIVSSGTDCVGAFDLLATLGVLVEDCSDGTDNDADDLIDCADPDCDGDPGCEDCDNGVDDDGDKLADCADPDCAEDPACAPPGVCGDGTVDSEEQCDDGNTETCDGCSDTCDTETGLVCGDGTLNEACGEQCDDGGTATCDGCSDTCQTESGEVCGDGTLNESCGEECDDGNTSPGDGCSDTCTLEDLADCLIDFDATPCPPPECGATFTGGSGCEFIGSASLCTDTGNFAYESTPNQPVAIDLAGDLTSLSVYFVAAGTEVGEMRFFDVLGLEVGNPLTTNANCLSAAGQIQTLTFPRPIRRIVFQPVITQNPPSTVYVDTFQVNPAAGNGR